MSSSNHPAPSIGSDRRLPIRPNLRQLRVQAKELLRAYRAGDPAAVAAIDGERRPQAAHEAEPDRRAPARGEPRLADAQRALARSYGVRSWPRLVAACRLVDAIWRDDPGDVRRLIEAEPRLRDEPALGTATSSWGPPMSYAANLGRDAVVDVLHRLGATDHERALDRAALQGRVGTGRRIHALAGAPPPAADALDGPAYTLSLAGTDLMLELGAPVVGADGRLAAPVAIVLETDSRDHASKHAILERYVERGAELPDTPTMALHRGRADLLAAHLARDPDLLDRRFAHEEIYPPELGCHDEVLATQGTPLAGTTLLHMAIDYDELSIARWLLYRGADPDAAASVDGSGFGGHTPLFSAVVSQPNYWMNRRDPERLASYAQLLLERGADPNRRASLRKQLHPGYGGRVPREYVDVTPLSWGRRFEDSRFVSRPAMDRIREAGGRE